MTSGYLWPVRRRQTYFVPAILMGPLSALCGVVFTLTVRVVKVVSSRGDKINKNHLTKPRMDRPKNQEEDKWASRDGPSGADAIMQDTRRSFSVGNPLDPGF